MKTIVLSPYTTNDDSIRIANRTAYHLKRNGLIPVVERKTGTQARRTIEKHRADLVVALNTVFVSGGGIGLYCNAKGLEAAKHVKTRMSEIQEPHEIRQPALHFLQLAPCPAIMVNDYRKEIRTEEIARKIAKGIVEYYGLTWKRTTAKKQQEERQKGE